MKHKSGVMVDETRGIDDAKRQAIALTLPTTDGEQLANLLGQVEFAINHLQSVARSQAEEQRPREIAEHLSRLAERATELSNALEDLGPEAAGVLYQKLGRAHVPGEQFLRPQDYLELLNEATSHFGGPLKERIARLATAARSYQPKGRPMDGAIGDFVNTILLVHEAATGKWPKRRTIQGRKGKRQEDIPFVTACFAAAGIATPPMRIIRQVIEGRKPHRPKDDMNAREIPVEYSQRKKDGAHWIPEGHQLQKLRAYSKKTPDWASSRDKLRDHIYASAERRYKIAFFYWISGHSAPQIAQLLRMSESAVKSVIHRLSHDE